MIARTMTDENAVDDAASGLRPIDVAVAAAAVAAGGGRPSYVADRK